MSSTISFRCPHCDARIKAPSQLLGQSRKCPGCNETFEVRHQPPADEAPRLVIDLSAFDMDLERQGVGIAE